jgi:uncharacterized protein YdgA (DUF945 family)
MKKLLSVVVIVAIIGVGGPYLLGVQAKRDYEHTIAAMAKDAKLPIKLTHYERGIFSSSAVTELAMPGAGYSLKVNHKIYHGPLLFDSSKVKPNGFHFGLALVQNTVVLEPEVPAYTTVRRIFGNQDPISWKSIIGFNGAIKTYIFSPAVEHTTDAGVVVSWKGLEGDVWVNKNYDAVKASLKAPGISVKGPDFNGGFKGWDYKVDYNQGAYKLWVGGGNTGVQQIEAQYPGHNYVIDSLDTHGVASLDSQSYQIKGDMKLVKAQTPMGQYGPGALFLSIFNIDPEGLEQLNDFLKKDNAGTSAELKPILKKLLLKMPTLTIDNTKLTLPEGDMTLDVKASVGGPAIASMGDEVNESAYLNTFVVNVDVLMPQLALKRFLTISVEKDIKAKAEVAALSEAEQKAAVDKEVNLKIEKVKNTGILSEEASNYRIKFGFEQGKLMANGKQVDESTL